MKRLIALTGIALALTACGTQPALAPAAHQAPVTAAARKAPGADQPGLMHHVLFFDEDGDRMITLSESRHGLERLGVGRLKSAAMSLVLNPILGKQASGSLTTTGIFGAGGRFVPTRFESLFMQTDLNKDGAWDSVEIDIMLQLDLIDPSLKKRTGVGFDLLLQVAGDREVTDDDGQTLTAISKNRLKSFYDGNLFYDVAAKNGR